MLKAGCAGQVVMKRAGLQTDFVGSSIIGCINCHDVY